MIIHFVDVPRGIYNQELMWNYLLSKCLYLFVSKITDYIRRYCTFMVTIYNKNY